MTAAPVSPQTALKRKRGRPRLPGARHITKHIRFNQAELQLVESALKTSGLTWPSWVRWAVAHALGVDNVMHEWSSTDEDGI